MIKLNITEVNEYTYTLITDDNKEYTVRIEFMDVVNKPNINDVIYVNEDLLKENNFYTFGPMDSIYGKKIKSEDDEDVLILEINNERIYLQRYYG